MLDKAAALGYPDAIRVKYNYPSSYLVMNDYSAEDITLELKEGVQLKLKWIPCKSFVMGSPKGEEGRTTGKSEDQKRVYFNYPGFYIGECEVTQEQYQAVMGFNPSKFPGVKNPVETVTLTDCADFCDELTNRYKKQYPDNYRFKLPTEAQWEYACRAGKSEALNSGFNLNGKTTSRNLDKVGWYSSNSGKTTHPAGLKKPNDWGLYDMHGNVAEWTEEKVLRGGSWNDPATKCRSASKNLGLSTRENNRCGFRVVLMPKGKQEDIEPLNLETGKSNSTGLRLW